MPQLADLEYLVTGGYWPSSADFPPDALLNTIKDGRGVWVRPGNRLQVANGIAQTSAQNVGARLFSLNTQRAEIAGALVSGRLPYAGILRYLNAALFFLSELASQQVYLDETAVAGLTTSATAGRLRIAVLAGAGYNVFDAGFDPPSLPAGNVTTPAGGTKSMTGSTGVALAAWRTATNAISAPSNTVYKALTPSTADIFKVVLPAMVSGQDGWILAGTRWGDQSGDVRIVRYVYTVPRGTFTATNGSITITGDANTRWLRDLRPGDVVTIDAASYTIATVTGDAAATLAANFAGATGAGKTATITTVAADWYNGELGDLLDRDALKPPPAAGVFQFAGRVFIWGTDGASGAVTGPGIRPTLANNPEHVGLLTILTSRGDDLVNVLATDQTLFLMTPNTLEAVTFTGLTDEPYKIRLLHEPGFQSATCGVIYTNRFYGFTKRPLRTVTDSDIDVEFAAPVWSVMAGWSAANVVLAVDPESQAVLYCHYSSVSGLTTIVPFMTQLGVWGVPHEIAGRVTDFAVVNGSLYLVVLAGGNYRVQTWEGGAGYASAYVGTQYRSDSNRWRIKGLVFTGLAEYLRLYIAEPGEFPPDVSVIASADASYQIVTSNKTHEEIFVNLPPGRALAVRLDFPTGFTGAFQRLVARGYPVEARR